MILSDKIHEVLRKYWGFQSFRPLQEDVITSILKGIDTIALLPTGGGKSICFQLPAMASDGICIVVSPLIALMKDQVDGLLKKKIAAAALFSGVSYNEQQDILSKAVNGKLKFLYVSPERLASEEFRSWLLNMDICFFAIDEAHCISQWGYDFRSEYLKIAEVRPLFLNKPILALTASATPRVVDDIRKNLLFSPNHVTITGSFVRSNLKYIVREFDNKLFRLVQAVKNLKGTGLIYTRNRKTAEELAGYLRQVNVDADYYHAGLPVNIRLTKQKNWIDNKCRIMTCTNAFGMGIDKPDVRFVIHYDPPESLEAYYQEAGRAGRDGKNSFCIMLFSNADIFKEKDRIREKYPSNEVLNKVYQDICNYLGIIEGSGKGISHSFKIEEFFSYNKLPILKIHYSIQILQMLGYLHLSETGVSKSTLKILLSEFELYKIQVHDEDLNELFLAILRERGGYFDHFTQIDELKIALKLNKTEAHVCELLHKYMKKGWVDYQPKTQKPVLTLLDGRYADIRPDRNKLHFLQKMAVRRFRAVENYLNNVNTCRNAMLAKYFGESYKDSCGVCDICTGDLQKKLTKDHYAYYTDLLKNALAEKSLSIEEIKNLVKPQDIWAIKEVLEWMMQNNWVVRDKKGLISWKKNR